jgi:hypothetical protein
MCSLRFENNFLTVKYVRFRFENSCLAIERVRFASKIIFLFYLMCSLRFENYLLTSEGVRFASISKKTPLSKFSFAFVSLALPLLVVIDSGVDLSEVIVNYSIGSHTPCFSLDSASVLCVYLHCF